MTKYSRDLGLFVYYLNATSDTSIVYRILMFLIGRNVFLTETVTLQ